MISLDFTRLENRGKIRLANSIHFTTFDFYYEYNSKYRVLF